MPKKDLHITFGFSGKALLAQSQLIDLNEDEILGFTDPLSQGPLYDLNDVQAIENRKRWLENIFGSIQSEGDNNFIDDELNLWAKLIDSVDDFNAIYLWLGDESNEKITTARLLYHLRASTIPIYRLNFDKMEFWNEKGVKLDLTSLQVMRVEHISDASQHFEKLSEDDKQAYVSIWKDIHTDQSTVHLFDRAGNYVSGDEAFFDHFLLDKCRDTFQRSSLIIGYTLFDIWEKFSSGCVGDTFLFHRLNEMAKAGKIEIANRHEDAERAKMIFDVRKVNILN